MKQVKSPHILKVLAPRHALSGLRVSDTTAGETIF